MATEIPSQNISFQREQIPPCEITAGIAAAKDLEALLVQLHRRRSPVCKRNREGLESDTGGDKVYVLTCSSRPVRLAVPHPIANAYSELKHVKT